MVLGMIAFHSTNLLILDNLSNLPVYKVNGCLIRLFIRGNVRKASEQESESTTEIP